MMVDLSLQTSFNDLSTMVGGSHINLLVCDEVIDHIDETTVANFVEILKEKSEDTTILLMAHRPFLDTIVPNKLLLTKKNGFTSKSAPIS